MSFEWSERRGVPRAAAYHAFARFKFGDGRSGGVRCAADSPVGLAGHRGAFAPSVLKADIPALLHIGVLDSLAGKLDVHVARTGARPSPPKLNRMGRYVLSVAFFGRERSESVEGPTLSACPLGVPPRRNVRIWPMVISACLLGRGGGVCSNLILHALFRHAEK